MQRILHEIMKKNNAWDIGRLVDNSFVQANQRTSVLYCRLTNFKLSTLKEAFGGRNMKKKKIKLSVILDAQILPLYLGFFKAFDRRYQMIWK